MRRLYVSDRGRRSRHPTDGDASSVTSTLPRDRVCQLSGNGAPRPDGPVSAARGTYQALLSEYASDPGTWYLVDPAGWIMMSYNDEHILQGRDLRPQVSAEELQ